MRIWVMFPNHLQFNSGGLIGRNNHLQGILLMSIVPYESPLGSLMYAMMCTKLDISHVVGTVSRFLSNPSREH
ncbi:hypothetical protein CR513_48415, partial [Mucuna pruriens]